MRKRCRAGESSSTLFEGAAPSNNPVGDMRRGSKKRRGTVKETLEESVDSEASLLKPSETHCAMKAAGVEVSTCKCGLKHVLFLAQRILVPPCLLMSPGSPGNDDEGPGGHAVMVMSPGGHPGMVMRVPGDIQE